MGFESKLSLKNVKSVYSGEPDKCCCGCAGTHTRIDRFIEVAGGVAEHLPPPCKINDKTIEEVIRIVQAAERVEVERNNFSTIAGGKLHIVYPESDFYGRAEIPTGKDAVKWMQEDLARIPEGELEIQDDDDGGVACVIFAKHHEYCISVFNPGDGWLGSVICSPVCRPEFGGEGSMGSDIVHEPLIHETWVKILDAILEIEALPLDCPCGVDHQVIEEVL